MKIFVFLIISSLAAYVTADEPPQTRQVLDDDGNPKLDADGNPMTELVPTTTTTEAMPAAPDGAAEAEENDEEAAEDEDGEEEEAQGEEAEAKLMIDPDVTAPENAVTDHYGNPLKTTELMNFTLENGAMVKVYSELWKTYYTKPATKPGCQCVTRAPLPKLKLYGNIHFKKIKVVPPSYVTIPTEPSSTICPPCNCKC